MKPSPRVRALLVGALLSFLGMGAALQFQGPHPGSLGPVVGYAGTIRSAGGVPGQAGAFRVLVRITSVDGGPIPLPPEVTIEAPAPYNRPPTFTYTDWRVSRFNDPYCDLAIQGHLSGPITQPATVAVDLTQSREVPWLKRLLSNASMARYSEVSTRSRLGTFILRPTSAVPTSAPKKSNL
jgi:hypothetical protein